MFEKYIKAVKALSESKEFEQYKKIFNCSQSIIILGNGGSNSIASHISQDFVKFHNKNSLAFSDPSMLTCFINDFGMENAYLKFLKSYAKNDSLVILISSKGESKNIINCATWCENNNINYGILTGFSDDNTLMKSAKQAVFKFHVDSDNYGVVECVHQIFLHGVI